MSVPPSGLPAPPQGTGWIPVPPRPDARPAAPPPRRWRRRRLFAALTLLVLAGPAFAVAAAVGGHPHGAYHFLATVGSGSGQEPVRWNPCDPIHYQVNTANAPADALQDVAEVTARVTQATGIAFEFDGTTGRTALSQVADLNYANLGEHIFDPLLVSWMTGPAFQDVVHERNVLAFTRLAAGYGDAAEQWASGVVVVDAGQDFATSGRYSLELVLQHEFGHVMGLGHVAAPDELMFSVEAAPHTSPEQMYGWGSGDLEGLALLGRDQGCLHHVDVAA
jgi:hypothetical protein